MEIANKGLLMAYKNDEDKKKYHREYYKKNKYKWEPTPEQREERRKYRLSYNKRKLANESEEKRDARLKRQREWYYRNIPTTEERRSRALMYRYGLSMNDYDAMFSEQKSCCAICGRHQSDLGKRLHVDHNHETKVIRGLLCTGCNTVLGRLEKNWDKIIGYLSGGYIGNREL